MGLQKVVCPECGAGLRSANPDGWAVGATVTCPKCEWTFPAAEPAPAVARPAKAESPDDEDEDEDAPRKRKKGKKGKKQKPAAGPNYVPWVVRGVVAVGLLVFAVFVLGEVRDRQRKNAEVEKENERIRQRNAEIEARDRPAKAKPAGPAP